MNREWVVQYAGQDYLVVGYNGDNGIVLKVHPRDQTVVGSDKVEWVTNQLSAPLPVVLPLNAASGEWQHSDEERIGLALAILAHLPQGWLASLDE